ncbi:MAG: glycosyltransferase, partial [Mobilitalea sp.]
MRILQINSVCGVGSTGRITTNLYHVLVEQGHECCISYGRGTAPESINTIKIGTDLDVYKHALYTRITDKTAFASKKTTQRFIEEVIKYNPDIIHLHNIHGYYVNIELLFRYFKESGKPVIWTLHDCWSFTGHCYHFDYIGCEKWKTGCYQCKHKKDYPASFIFDHSKENYLRKKALITSSDRLILVPPTKWLSTLVSESYLSKFPRVIIPNGIDLDLFKPTGSDLRRKYLLENKYIVLGVSNGFSEYKGSKYFALLAKNLTDEYKVVLIGVKEEERRLFPNNVLLLPRTNNTTELAEFYTLADVFVNPTLQETQGLTNIEALACGTPVVTFNSGGSPECIDSSCGYVVERDDGEGLIKAVKQACIAPFV